MFGITDELIEHIKFFEGFRSHPYICPGGYPTIGYGHRIKSLDELPISEPDAEQLLRQDLVERQKQALKLSPNLTNQSERRVAAIIDFIYNVGSNNYKSSTLKKVVDLNDWNEASVQIQRWIYGGNPKRQLEGLKKRRSRVAEWLIEG